MIVSYAKNQQERPLQESSWNDLLATDKAGTDREKFVGVKLTVNDAWLKKLELELIADDSKLYQIQKDSIGIVHFHDEVFLNLILLDEIIFCHKI